MVLKWLDVVRMTKGKTLMRAGRTSIAPELFFRLASAQGGMKRVDSQGQQEQDRR